MTAGIKILEDIKKGEYYSVKEVAKILGVSLPTVYKKFQMGMLDYYSISEGKTIITKTQLADYLESVQGKSLKHPN